MEMEPNRRVEGGVVVQHHAEATVGSVEHEEGTWQDDVTIDSSESLHRSSVL